MSYTGDIYIYCRVRGRFDVSVRINRSIVGTRRSKQEWKPRAEEAGGTFTARTPWSRWKEREERNTQPTTTANDDCPRDAEIPSTAGPACSAPLLELPSNQKIPFWARFRRAFTWKQRPFLGKSEKNDERQHICMYSTISRVAEERPLPYQNHHLITYPYTLLFT